jgi:hypothetical protein
MAEAQSDQQLLVALLRLLRATDRLVGAAREIEDAKTQVNHLLSDPREKKQEMAVTQ